MKSKSYWKRVNSYSHHLLQAFETDNQMLIAAAAAALHQTRLAEDAAYRRFSGKDFSSDDLKAAYLNLNWIEGKLLNHAPTAELQKWVKHQKYIGGDVSSRRNQQHFIIGIIGYCDVGTRRLLLSEKAVEHFLRGRGRPRPPLSACGDTAPPTAPIGIDAE